MSCESCENLMAACESYDAENKRLRVIISVTGLSYKQAENKIRMLTQKAKELESENRQISDGLDDKYLEVEKLEARVKELEEDRDSHARVLQDEIAKTAMLKSGLPRWIAVIEAAIGEHNLHHVHVGADGAPLVVTCSCPLCLAIKDLKGQDHCTTQR